MRSNLQQAATGTPAVASRSGLDLPVALLEALERRGPIDHSAALVAAHPDDETIGMGGVMARLRDLTVLSLTDGAPRDEQVVAAAGFASPVAYAEARRRELVDALHVATDGLSRLVAYEFADGTLYQHLDVLIERLEADLISVDVVFTHPYEGGHIDHDAAAYAVQTACRRLERAGCHAPVRLEFTSYYHFNGLLRTGLFHTDPKSPEVAVPLSPDALWRKEQAMFCHKTQEANLRYFGFGPERFRVAPRYDFARPPPTNEVVYGRGEWAKLARAIADVPR